MQATDKKMNKVWLSVLSVGAAAALMLGIAGLVNQGDLEKNTIPTVNQQIENIEKTLPQMDGVSMELKCYITTLEEAVAKLESDLAATNTAIDTVETEVYGKVDAEKTGALQQLKADKTELETKIADTNKAIEAAKAANTASEKLIADQIAALETQLETADADNKSAIEAQIAALQTALEKADADNKVAIETQIAALTEELKKVDADNKAAIEAQIAALQTALEKADADNKSAIEAQIAALKTELEAADAANKQAIEDKIAKLNADLTALIQANANNITALQTTAEDLQKQITDTNTKIDTARTELEGKLDASEKKVLNELNALKTSIQAQIAAINTDIADLKTKDTELDGKIADLKVYVDSEITATEDWANATFATLEQYSAVQTTIAGIKTDIENVNSKIAAVESDVASKVAAINASITGLDSKLATKVTEVINGYTNAIATAKAEIAEAYTKAIADAITASETSMKTWVTDTLASGYYTIAAMDAKLKAITDVAATDEELASAVALQQAALLQAKTDLEAAYTAAISDAIDTNNGVVDGKIADAVNTAKIQLEGAINAINTELTAIKNRLTAVENEIAGIREELDDNAAADDETKQALEAKIAELQAQIDVLTELAALCPGNQFTITFDTDGGSAVAAITQSYHTAVTAPADPTKTGYTFAGWDAELPATMPAENITLKAKWTVNQYTITFDTDGGNAIAPITQDYGTAVTAPANPSKNGYTFTGWDRAIPSAMPAENITVKAKWEKLETYTVTWKNWDGTVLETDRDVVRGTTPTYNGHGDPQRSRDDQYVYKFKGWTPSVAPVTGDVTYTATFNATPITEYVYQVGDVVTCKSSTVKYCKGCGTLMTQYTATITGIRGELDGELIYWITLGCCGYRTSVVETAITGLA